jgi:hypothetical protein
MISPPGAAALRSKPSIAARLFDLQLAFNLFPATYVHSGWLVEMGLLPDLLIKTGDPRSDAADGGIAPASPFWVRRLSNALLRRWRLDQQFDCDFFDPAKRLALLDAAELIRIGGLAGAVLMRDRIRRTVDRAAIAVMQQSIGADAHRFALRYDRQLPELDTLSSEWTRQWNGSWPEVDAWTARSAILLSSAIPVTAPGVLGRLQFKFPRSWTSEASHRLRLTEQQRASLAELLVDIVAEHSTEWAWLFAQAAPDAMRSPLRREA